MFSFGHGDRPQFGGVGLMVEPPSVEVKVAPSAQFDARGILADRVRRFVDLALQSWRVAESPKCSIELASPADHRGLGVGTQLGLAVAAALRQFLRLPELPIEALAASVGRGRRSAVGMYGFRHGGLIVDAGRRGDLEINRLVARVDVPSKWRFVLVCPRDAQGLAGEVEATAFANLPPVPEAVTRQLWQITNSELLPALERRDCDEFGDAVFRFGRLAGECFTAVQGGPFASQQIERLVDTIRRFGVRGAGQSSWGPTVFAVTPDDGSALELADWLSQQPIGRDCDVVIAHANNQGASINSA